MWKHCYRLFTTWKHCYTLQCLLSLLWAVLRMLRVDTKVGENLFACVCVCVCVWGGGGDNKGRCFDADEYFIKVFIKKKKLLTLVQVES